MIIDHRLTERPRSHHQENARWYDMMETFPEHRFNPWRKQLWIHPLFMVGNSKMRFPKGGAFLSLPLDNRSETPPESGLPPFFNSINAKDN